MDDTQQGADPPDGQASGAHSYDGGAGPAADQPPPAGQPEGAGPDAGSSTGASTAADPTSTADDTQPDGRKHPSGGTEDSTPPPKQAGPRPADEGAAGLASEDRGAAPDESWAREQLRRQDRRLGFAGTPGITNDTQIDQVNGGAGRTVVGSGAQYHEHHNNYAHTTESAFIGEVDPGLVRTALDLDVRGVGPAEDERRRDILDRLKAHRALYEAGQDHTGRRHAGQMMLAELCGPDKINVISLVPGTGLAPVLTQKKFLRPGHGHLVRLSSTEWIDRETLQTAGGTARAAEAYLMIVGPLPVQGIDDLGEYAVSHRPPDPASVLRKHLTHELCCLKDRRRHSDEWPAACLQQVPMDILEYVEKCLADPAIIDHLQTGPPPREVVDLAKGLAGLRRNSRPIAAALDLLTTSLRRLAGKVLEPPAPDIGASATWTHDRRIAFRIAYAVFYDHPLSVVYEADSVLHALIDPADQTARAKRVETVFGDGVNTLLDPQMRGGGQDDEGQRPETERGDVRARLVDERLADTILDVAWNTYYRLRQPLLQWLGLLAGDPRERVRLRAAQAVGQLATYNYGYVYREVLRPWASSELVRHRETASLTLEFLKARDPGQVARVRAQLRDWSAAGNPYLNDTAARAYATSLGTAFFDDMLINLRYIARKPSLTASRYIAQALAENYQPEVAAAIVEALADWVWDGEQSLRVHAGWTAIFLAHRQQPAVNGSWPVLLSLAESDPALRKKLIHIWRAALGEFATGRRAWERQRVWLVQADGRGDHEAAVIRWALDLWATDGLRVRAIHHIERIWTDDVDLPVMQRLLKMLKEK